MEEAARCKSTALTLTGGKYSLTLEKTSEIFKTRRFLMFLVEKILKDKLLLSGEDTTEPTKDGELSMLTKLPRFKVRDTARNMDSIS
jgi:hypothetical protein